MFAKIENNNLRFIGASYRYFLTIFFKNKIFPPSFELLCLSCRIFAEVNIWKKTRTIYSLDLINMCETLTVYSLDLVNMLSENISLVSSPCLGSWAADHRGGGNRTDDPARLGVHQQAIAGRRHCRWRRWTGYTVVGLIKKKKNIIKTDGFGTVRNQIKI